MLLLPRVSKTPAAYTPQLRQQGTNATQCAFAANHMDRRRRSPGCSPGVVPCQRESQFHYKDNVRRTPCKSLSRNTETRFKARCVVSTGWSSPGALRKLDYSHWEPKLKLPRATAMEQYLGCHHILYKDYAAHVKAVSKRIQEASLAPFRQDDLPVIHLKSPRIDKDAVAREEARKRGIQEGRVCAITAVKLHPTFQHYKTILVRRRRPCGVTYQYQIHPQVGWMYARFGACQK